MRRLFIQFYLLLIGCFTLAILLIGLVYQVSAERAGTAISERMMQAPRPAHWRAGPAAARNAGPPAPASRAASSILPLQIGVLANQPLASEDQAFLEAGNIVIVEEDDTFLQRIPNTDKVLIVGPVPTSPTCTSCTGWTWGCCCSSAFPSACPSCSGCAPTGAACNSSNRPPAGSATGISPVALVCRPAAAWAGSAAPSTRWRSRLQAMLASRKQLTDAIAHELRSPGAAALSPRHAGRASLTRGAAGTGAGPRRPRCPHRGDADLCQARSPRTAAAAMQRSGAPGSWAGSRLADWQALRPDKRLDFVRPAMALPWRGDTDCWTGRWRTSSATPLRHATSQASLCIARQGDDYLLEVADDGPGIDPALAPQIFEPFVRLDQSQDRRTGGAGLGWPSCAVHRPTPRRRGATAAKQQRCPP